MIAYRRWIKVRLRERRREYIARPEPGLLSLVTPVLDTPPRFLRAMARSVFAQDYPWFEWVIVDNGSQRPTTRQLLARVAREPRVRLLRLERNRGIMAGTRHAVNHARGRYVLPVDADDLLYPDALRVMAAVLQAHDYPALAYSDEDKLLPNGRADYPFLKPDWDPVLFFNCCYVAHLCAIDRSLAAEVGAYSDDAAHGCHDWDTFWRFVRAGHEPVHVPEVLYSWRMHAGSTATPDTAPKPYTLDCQHYVLTNHVRTLGLEDRVEIRTNPLFRNVGMWHAARRQVAPVPFHVLLWGHSGGAWRGCLRALAESSYPMLDVQLCGPGISPEAEAELAEWQRMPGRDGIQVKRLPADRLNHPRVNELVAALPPETPVVLLSDEVTPLSLDWPWEALGLLERHPEVALIGGRIVDSHGTTESAGEIFGADGFLGSPDRGRRDTEFGCYGLHISQRGVDAVPAEFCVVRAGFLHRALAHPRISDDLPMCGAWLGALARRQGQRIVCSPHIVGQCRDWGTRRLDLADVAAFRAEFGELGWDDRHYSRHYARDAEHAYQLVPTPHFPAGVKFDTRSSASIRA